MFWLFWCQLTQVVLEKETVKCVSNMGMQSIGIWCQQKSWLLMLSWCDVLPFMCSHDWFDCLVRACSMNLLVRSTSSSSMKRRHSAAPLTITDGDSCWKLVSENSSFGVPFALPVSPDLPRISQQTWKMHHVKIYNWLREIRGVSFSQTWWSPVPSPSFLSPPFLSPPFSP